MCAAITHAIRRAILTKLTTRMATVNELAAPLQMSQPAISKHLKVLEHTGLIERSVEKQKRPAKLHAEYMAAAVKWLEEFKQFWTVSFDQLDDLLMELKAAEQRTTDHDCCPNLCCRTRIRCPAGSCLAHLD